MSEGRPVNRSISVGVTGGIGSGKSTVTAMFSDLGIATLDLDQLGHRVLEEEPEVRDQLIECFGETIQAGDGSIDRKQLAALAFRSDEATRRLEAIVHPAIWRREAAWLEAQSGSYVIIEASVLIEAGGAARMDRVVVVLADLATRKDRVLRREAGMDEEMFDRIVQRQCDDRRRRQVATDIIDNSSGLIELRSEVEAFHHRIIGTGGVDTK